VILFLTAFVYRSTPRRTAEHADQVSSECKSCFFQLRELRIIHHNLTLDAAKTVVRAFFNNKLEYFNGLSVGTVDGVRLPGIQKATARLINGTRKFSDVTLVIRFYVLLY